MVLDEEILYVYRLLVKIEGVFVELGLNVLLVGVIKYVKFGKIKKGEIVVVVLIGNGLKDFDIVIFLN